MQPKSDERAGPSVGTLETSRGCLTEGVDAEPVDAGLVHVQLAARHLDGELGTLAGFDPVEGVVGAGVVTRAPTSAAGSTFAASASSADEVIGVSPMKE